ncbi:myeloid differentiation primary response protein MyD88 [Saccoglossus kowalevskii]|uniref:Myeloid differentiation primary response protein MyD88 n=1 Tax=Saccoglossus kowalevskii TaxID=10224 RepID=A0ABM0MV72_SACKO|nr:PREDICTED: myeloid differentiation primary response protein MyD88 [Saccoglossus kowalevskii]
MAEVGAYGFEEVGEARVPASYFSIPANIIRPKSLLVLCQHMNIPRPGKDWMMLADNMDYSMLEIQTFERSQDPTRSLMNDWGMKGSTIGELLQMLLDLDRYDVFDDLRKPLERDIGKWKIDQKKAQDELDAPIQVNEIHTSTQSVNYPNLPSTDELRGITLRDHASGPPEIFDAYVCACDKDHSFVLEVMKRLEKPPYNLKLCVEFRDLVPGNTYVSATVELIHNRCKRMIIVVSPDFLNSEQCEFQAKVALSFSPGARMKRIVPILLKACEMPPILRHITKCDYTRPDLREWFWQRLFRSLNLR